MRVNIMRENRKNNETREIKFTRNYTKHAYGSVLTEFGGQLSNLGKKKQKT